MVKAEKLWKSFPAVMDRPGLKEYVTHFTKHFRRQRDKFWALRDVSFEVKKGECFGVIGRNGAGKSTLLALLLGVMYPTQGEISVVGKRTPLLELGAGFHPELTGNENVLLNGVLLGCTEQEMHERMDEIVEFAELSEFIGQPVRTYSSGMYMRLAFSVAIHTNPEVLLIDEILAVGDEAFQKKSGKAMMELINAGVTTVYISHNMESVKRICDRVMWLEHGEIAEIGDPDMVVEKYLRSYSALG